MLTAETLNKLTKPEIFACITQHAQEGHASINLSAKVRNSKPLLVQFVINNLTPTLETRLRVKITEKASQKRGRGNHEDDTEGQVPRQKRHCNRAPDPATFMETVSEETVTHCHSVFVTATSNANIALIVCTVCARENIIDKHPSTYTVLPLNKIPNPKHLSPTTPHLWRSDRR